MKKFGVETTGVEVVQSLHEHGQGKTSIYRVNLTACFANGDPVVITGPSKDGIGAEIAVTVARAKPKVLILLGRSEAKIRPVIEAIKEQGSGVEAVFIQCDLCDHSSVRRAAQETLSRTDHIDVLINNAGVMAVRSYETSVDGVEKQFAAGYLGHFLLTNHLKAALVAAKGIIINMTSSAYTLAEVDTTDPNFENGKTYDPWKAYARTKTADILFSYALASRYGASGLSSLAVDPGMVTGTKLMANSGVDVELMQKGMAMAVERNGGNPLPPHPMVNLQQGCATALLACLDPSLKAQSPAFVKECVVTPTLPYAHDVQLADKLWALSERLVGETF